MAYTEKQCDQLWDNAWTALYGLTIAQNTKGGNLCPKKPNQPISSLLGTLQRTLAVSLNPLGTKLN